MSDCIFCRIVAGEIPADIRHSDDNVIAFPDIHPLAPVHILIVSRKHFSSVSALSEADASVLTDMVNAANRLAKEMGISESGFRLVLNCGQEGGQTVPHLHMHLLGGRPLSGILG